MEYRKIIYLLDNTQNQLSKFRTKNWIEVNDQSRGAYNTSSDIRFKDQSLVYVIIVMHTYLFKGE